MANWKPCLEVGKDVEQYYIGHHESQSLRDTGIYLGGIIDARGHYVRRQHTMEFSLLVYTMEGEGSLINPYTSQPLYEQSACIIPAGEAAGLQLNSPHWKFAWLSIHNEAKWQYLRDLPLGAVISPYVPTIFHLISALYYEYRRDPTNTVAHQQCAHLLLSSVEASLQHEFKQDFVHTKLVKLFSGVERQIQYPWTVEEMAAKLHYSVPHFHRLCTKYFEMSPKQYVLKLKMERAKTMLRSRHYSVSQVANFLGYSETSSFSHSFKKYFGVSPAHMERK